MGGEVKQRHHIKAMVISAIFLVVCIGFIMWLKGQAAQTAHPRGSGSGGCEKH